MSDKRLIDAKPGELCDKRGVPIHVGDLLRTYHYRERRRREVKYLYHVICERNGRLFAVPTSHLAKGPSGGGDCLLGVLADAEGVITDGDIISGYGPVEGDDFTDRPRRKLATPAARESPTRTFNHRVTEWSA